MSYKKASDVLNYWFGGGDRSKRPRWFGGGEEATQEIRNKFGTLVSEDIQFLVLYLSRNATPVITYVDNISSLHRAIHILICLYCFSSSVFISFFIGVYCLYYPLNIFPTQEKSENWVIRRGGRAAVGYQCWGFPQVAPNFFGKLRVF